MLAEKHEVKTNDNYVEQVMWLRRQKSRGFTKKQIEDFIKSFLELKFNRPFYRFKLKLRKWNGNDYIDVSCFDYFKHVSGISFVHEYWQIEML